MHNKVQDSKIHFLKIILENDQIIFKKQLEHKNQHQVAFPHNLSPF